MRSPIRKAEPGIKQTQKREKRSERIAGKIGLKEKKEL